MVQKEDLLVAAAARPNMRAEMQLPMNTVLQRDLAGNAFSANVCFAFLVAALAVA